MRSCKQLSKEMKKFFFWNKWERLETTMKVPKDCQSTHNLEAITFNYRLHDYPFCKLFCSSGAHPELASAQDFGGRAGAFLLATSMLNLCGDDRLGILFGNSESTSSIMTEDVFADGCAFVASAIERPKHLLRIRFYHGFVYLQLLLLACICRF